MSRHVTTRHVASNFFHVFNDFRTNECVLENNSSVTLRRITCRHVSSRHVTSPRLKQFNLLKQITALMFTSDHVMSRHVSAFTSPSDTQK